MRFFLKLYKYNNSSKHEKPCKDTFLLYLSEFKRLSWISVTVMCIAVLHCTMGSRFPIVVTARRRSIETTESVWDHCFAGTWHQQETAHIFCFPSQLPVQSLSGFPRCRRRCEISRAFTHNRSCLYCWLSWSVTCNSVHVPLENDSSELGACSPCSTSIMLAV